MRIATIVGARPQFIKAAAVSSVLRPAHSEILIHTGQHFDRAMSDVFFDELGIPAADHNCGVHGGTRGEMLGRMLEALEIILRAERPDAVLVYGDTNSTLAGALAASGLGIAVAHVEAGLRSGDSRMAEERNRIAVDRVATLRLCTHNAAAQQLRVEGLQGGIHVVGDVMRDVLELGVRRLGPRGSAPLPIARGGPYAVATVHRAENTDDAARLGAILAGLEDFTLPVVLPLHPRTRARIDDAALGPNVTPAPPLGYLDMLNLCRSADVIITDSGGLQKEAYWLGVPCLTVRDSTEWTETVASGWNRLVAADAAAIRRAGESLQRPDAHPELYGAPGAAVRIVAALQQGLRS